MCSELKLESKHQLNTICFSVIPLFRGMHILFIYFSFHLSLHRHHFLPLYLFIFIAWHCSFVILLWIFLNYYSWWVFFFLASSQCLMHILFFCYIVLINVVLRMKKKANIIAWQKVIQSQYLNFYKRCFL